MVRFATRGVRPRLEVLPAGDAIRGRRARFNHVYGPTRVCTPDPRPRPTGSHRVRYPADSQGDGGGGATAGRRLSLAGFTVVVCAQFGARSGADAATELRSALAALGTDYILERQS